MNLPQINVTWAQRQEPLSPVCVAAIGDRATALGLRLLKEDYQESFVRLQAVVTDNILLLFGAVDDLPWVDGALYLGKDSQAGSMLIPTNLAPSVPMDVVFRAILKGFPAAPPVVLLPKQGLLFSASPARPISKDRLVAWLEGIS